MMMSYRNCLSCEVSFVRLVRAFLPRHDRDTVPGRVAFGTHARKNMRARYARPQGCTFDAKSDLQTIYAVFSKRIFGVRGSA